MPSDHDALLKVLRYELDATNQQFIHILALKLWKEKDVATRITEVDDVDFANSMRIIDYLVSTHTPITLPAGNCSPGTDYASILLAERAMENRLSNAIDDCPQQENEWQYLVEAARAPREAYASWLDDNIADVVVEEPKQDPLVLVTADLGAHLLTLIEESLIHAYIHWHADDKPAADAAWATSGAAMMHMTRLVQLFSRLPGVPVPGDCPVANIQCDPDATLDADRILAKQCSQQALATAESCDHEAIARFCTETAEFYQGLACWQVQTPHPAIASNPPVFHSFEATLNKFFD